MLLQCFPGLKSSKFICLLNRFFYSKYYIFLVGLLTLLCNIFGFEIYYYYFLAIAFIATPVLLCDDLLPIVVPFSMTYSSVSLKSNNASGGSSIVGGNNTFHLIFIASLVIFALIARIVFNLVCNRKMFVKPKLLLGYCFLAPCYLLGGIFTKYYQTNTVLYGLVNFCSISLLYFVLLFSINWKQTKADYFFHIMTTYGLVLVFEVLYIYIKYKSGDNSFISVTGHLFTGWGMRNNIAGQISLCVAAPLFLSIRKIKLTPLYIFLSCCMVVACLLVGSRSGFVASLLFMFAGIIVLLVKCKDQRTILGSCLFVLIIISVGALITFEDEVSVLFARFIDEGLSVSSTPRPSTWLQGILHFIENPLFGVGFYQCKYFIFYNFSTGFVPPRYHDIYVQFLASTGLFGLVAYFYHRYETLIITFKKPTLEKTFIYFTVAALVITSFVDNHFFNMGPGLNYCVALAFIEGQNIKESIFDSEPTTA